MTLLRLALLLSAFFVPLVWSGKDPIDCSAVKGGLQHGHTVSLDAYVHVVECHINGLPVLAWVPYRGDHFEFLRLEQGSEKQALVSYTDELALFADRLRSVAGDVNAPILYGGCWDDTKGGAVTLVEHTEGWLSVVLDQRLNGQDRLKIAINALELVHMFDIFPIEQPRTAFRQAILADFHARQFSLSSMLVPKFQGWHPEGLLYHESGTQFGSEVKCTSDLQCQRFFFTHRHIMESLSVHSPNDFGCSRIDGHCRGLGHATTLYAVCRVLLLPLLGFHLEGVERGAAQLSVKNPDGVHSLFKHSTLSEVRATMATCLNPNQRNRTSVHQLRGELVKHLSRGSTPPKEHITPLNMPLSRFLNQSRGTGDQLLQSMPGDLAAHNDALIGPNAGGSGGGGGGSAASKEKAKRLHKWYFRFHASERTEINNGPVRLFGLLVDGRTADSDMLRVLPKAWASSTIVARDAARLVQASSGNFYALEGEPNCDKLRDAGFPSSICRKFAHGFPDDWQTLLAKEHHRQFISLYEHFYADQREDGGDIGSVVGEKADVWHLETDNDGNPVFESFERPVADALREAYDKEAEAAAAAGGGHIHRHRGSGSTSSESEESSEVLFNIDRLIQKYVKKIPNEDLEKSGEQVAILEENARPAPKWLGEDEAKQEEGNGNDDPFAKDELQPFPRTPEDELKAWEKVVKDAGLTIEDVPPKYRPIQYQPASYRNRKAKNKGKNKGKH